MTEIFLQKFCNLIHKILKLKISLEVMNIYLIHEMIYISQMFESFFFRDFDNFINRNFLLTL